VTVRFDGTHAALTLFSNLTLTAWRRVISPPSPPGPRPAIAPSLAAAQSPAPQRTFLVRRRPANKPAIRMDSLGHTYVISDVSKNGKIRVDALGYLQISVTANTPPPSSFPLKQGNNRFTANVLCVPRGTKRPTPNASRRCPPYLRCKSFHISYEHYSSDFLFPPTPSISET
jgi:hypothetical protein